MVLILFSSCHRDLTDPFIPKDKKFDTQFKFSPRKNRTVEKHSSFARSQGGFKDSFGYSKHGGRKGGGGKDSFSFKPSKRTGGGFGKDSFSSRKGKRTGGGFGKDSFSSRKGKRTGGGFGKDSFSSRKGKRTGGGFGKDSFSSKRGKKTGGGFAKDSYSSSGKSRFGKAAPRFLTKRGGNKDSYSLKHKKVSGMFRFSKTSNSIVSKQKFLVFGSHKRSAESGSFRAKHKKFSGQFRFSKNKGMVSKKRMVFNGTKRLRASESFNVGIKRHPRAFGFNAEKKRVSPIVSLIRHKDTDEGSFGHGRKNSNFSRQYVFSKKQKRVKKRDSIWWDMNQSFHKKKRKKKSLELELFDPKMKRQMKLAK